MKPRDPERQRTPRFLRAKQHTMRPLPRPGKHLARGPARSPKKRSWSVSLQTVVGASRSHSPQPQPSPSTPPDQAAMEETQTPRSSPRKAKMTPGPHPVTAVFSAFQPFDSPAPRGAQARSHGCNPWIQPTHWTPRLIRAAPFPSTAVLWHVEIATSPLERGLALHPPREFTVKARSPRRRR